jgi:3-dehydroquinate synthetase
LDFQISKTFAKNLEFRFTISDIFNQYFQLYQNKPGTTAKEINAAKNLGLPTFHKDFTDFDLMKLSLLDTMKHRNNNQYLPLPIEIGNYKIINDLSDEEIKNAMMVFKTL